MKSATKLKKDKADTDMHIEVKEGRLRKLRTL